MIESLENQPNDTKIKSVIEKQNVIIDDQRKMMKEQQKQIDELRKLKDQLDSGRAITNKVCNYGCSETYKFYKSMINGRR